MEDCIFCKIIDKEAPAKVVFEDDSVIAFEPLEKVSQGHTLVVPKQHFQDLFDIPTENLEQMMKSVKPLAAKIAKDNNATGINLLHASGKDAQQSVFHFHLHLVPRYPNDNLDLWVKNKL